ncbi:MAG: MarR family transcriptional regulator [Muribaculaceae bacterium]|nr:MarR family transcriptional regulator [Muribaculaceae bacterium]
MKKENMTYETPFLGCLVGAAFQKLTSELEMALKAYSLNISASEYMVLRALFTSDGLQQCQIAEMVGKDKAAVSRCVAALVKKELVRSEQVSYKCCKAWLTEKSLALKPQIMNIAFERHKALLNLASDSEIQGFISVLNKIVKDS